MAGKLTKSELDQLVQIKARDRYHIGHRVAVATLVAKGLAWTNNYGCTGITPAGRAALSQREGE